MKHFLFEEGEWLGEGLISFSTSKEKIKFFVKWIISKEKDKEIKCVQIVELVGLDDKVINMFAISEITATDFKIILDNSVDNHLLGKGKYDQKKVAWEFIGNSELEGFEIFELQEDGIYIFNSEYFAIEDFRTIVHGSIWKKQISIN